MGGSRSKRPSRLAPLDLPVEFVDNSDMRALSIRQPFAELILRGMKPIEYRSRPTRIIGERFWIYASKQPVRGWRRGARRGIEADARIAWSTDLAVEAPAPWMIELANALRLFPRDLPTGVIVGSAIIEKVVAVDSFAPASTDERPIYYEWHLTGIQRARRARRPSGHPQPVWFEPF